MFALKYFAELSGSPKMFANMNLFLFLFGLNLLTFELITLLAAFNSSSV